MSEGLALASPGGDGTGCEFPERPKADFRPHPADLLRAAFVSAPRVGGDFVRCRPVRALCWIGFVPRADALGCSSFAAFAAFLVVPAPDPRRGFSGRSGTRSSSRLFWSFRRQILGQAEARGSLEVSTRQTESLRHIVGLGRPRISKYGVPHTPVTPGQPRRDILVELN